MQRVEYYEKPQKIIVTFDNANYYKAYFDSTAKPLKVSLTGKNSYAKLNARYVPAIDKYNNTQITWKESSTTNSYIILTANKGDNEGSTYAIVQSSSCYIRPNDVINEITKKNNYVSQKIKASTNVEIYDDNSNPFAYKYVDVVISEGAISDISTYSALTQNIGSSAITITLDCKLAHDKFNLTPDDCNYTIQSGITWITYKTKTLSNDGLYNFTFDVSANTAKSERSATITLKAEGITKTVIFNIVQEGRGDIITGVNSGVNNNTITLYTNGTPNSSTPNNYQLSPSLKKS